MKLNRLALVATLGMLIGTFAADATACDPQKELAQRRAEVAAKADDASKARGHFETGIWARDNGLAKAAKAEFEAVIALDSDHRSAREALGYSRAAGKWVPFAEAMRHKGLVRRDGVWMLREEAQLLDLPKEERQRRKDAMVKVNQLLRTYATSKGRARKYALESLGTVDDKYKADPMAYALRWKSKDVRLLAAKELGRLKNRRALRPLVHRAVYDTDDEVRFAAIDAAKAIGEVNLLAPLARVLASQSASPLVRANAASAIGHVGDMRGVAYLVYKYEAHGGGAPRVFFSDITQLTFIQDFDVEVAQTAFIADPIVGVIQEGIVLDMKVVATSDSGYIIERQAIHSSLRKLTGATDVPDQKGAWAKWYKANKDKLVAINK